MYGLAVDILLLFDEVVEKQYYEMQHRLGLVRKEANDLRDIADADYREAQSCRESLPQVHSVMESNKKITFDLIRESLGKERLAEDALRQRIRALKADLASAEDHEGSLFADVASLREVGRLASPELDSRRARAWWGWKKPRAVSFLSVLCCFFSVLQSDPNACWLTDIFPQMNIASGVERMTVAAPLLQRMDRALVRMSGSMWSPDAI